MVSKLSERLDDLLKNFEGSSHVTLSKAFFKSPVLRKGHSDEYIERICKGVQKSKKEAEISKSQKTYKKYGLTILVNPSRYTFVGGFYDFPKSISHRLRRKVGEKGNRHQWPEKSACVLVIDCTIRPMFIPRTVERLVNTVRKKIYQYSDLVAVAVITKHISPTPVPEIKKSFYEMQGIRYGNRNCVCLVIPNKNTCFKEFFEFLPKIFS